MNSKLEKVQSTLDATGRLEGKFVELDLNVSRLEEKTMQFAEQTPDQIQLEMHGNICSTDSEFQIEVSNRFSALAEEESSDSSFEGPYFTDEEFSDSLEDIIGIMPRERSMRCMPGHS